MSPFGILPLPTLLLLLMVMQPPLLTHSSSTSNSSTDHLALLSFKSHAITTTTTTSSLQALSSWNDTFTFCRWPGVLCNDTRNPGRVTHLRLGSFKLSGTISPSLSNLTFLTTLNLSFNSLHGSIPRELGLLTRLEYLNLRSNSLGGEIPRGLTRYCSHLKILYLENNRLQGAIPTNLSRCTNLEYLFLSHNKLGRRIPSELGGLPRLLQLRLDHNNLTGSIPPSLGNISSLRKLSLSYNNLEGSIPVELGRLAGLYVLDLVSNQLTGRILSALIYNFSYLYGFGLANNDLSGPLPLDFGAKLPNLVQVYLYDNQLDGPIPPSITNASRLGVLSLTNNKFSGTVPRKLGSLIHLERLQLAQNRLEATRPKDWSFITSLTNCTRLLELDIWKNNFSGSLPTTIGNLSVKMERLGMGYNKITGSMPSGIGNLVSLQEFNAEKGLFSGSIPGTIGKLKNLHIISLAKNGFSGVIPSSTGNLSQLLELHLNENSLSGFIPESLASLKKLNILDLSYNHLTGNVPKGLFGISSLSSFLNISHNSLEGQLPDAFQSLINLVAIDVSGNKFSGGIPLSLGGCQQLEYLNVGDNGFTGTIPGSLGDLKGILSLNLSNNHLSGPIPKFLEVSFPGLQFLNLSFNDFEGEPPTDGLFKNSSLFSVVGNERLCGGISELQLRACSGKRHSSSRTIIIIAAIVALIFFIVFLFLLHKCVRSRTSKKAALKHHDPENEPFLKVTYRELVTATNGFSPANLIGQGGFGVVYRGILEPQQLEVAVKVLYRNIVGVSKSFVTECNVLRSIRHRNLARILTACSTFDFEGNDFKALVYEFMPNGSLEAWLHPHDEIVGSESRTLNAFQRLRIARDVASVIDYLHNHTHEPIVHCDLKPSNIFLRDDMAACIGDFGIARFLSGDAVSVTSGIKGSIGYIAPECGMGSPISPLWDVYSFGILLLEMFTSRSPTDETFTGDLDLHGFVNSRFPEQIAEVIDPKMLIPERRRVRECLVDIMEVALHCSKKLPSERMSIHDASLRLDAIMGVISDLEDVRGC